MNHKDLEMKKMIQKEMETLQDEDIATHRIEAELSSCQHPEEYRAFWEMVELLSTTKYSEKEPSDLISINAAAAPLAALNMKNMDGDAIYHKLHGAWLGRCCGCTLGKPVEGWSSKRIEQYLTAANTFPLDGYIPAIEVFPEGLKLWNNYVGTTKGNIQKMVRDDDIDYTVLALKTLKTYGREYTTADIGTMWLENFSFYSIFTAEAAAYRNLVNEIEPPRTATFRNPYREYIGAQIRADMWGYVNPGDPIRAAEFAFRDASLSHTKNGIYGAMWAAACIAAAFAVDDVQQVIEYGLSVIPQKSRLSIAIKRTMNWVAQIGTWEGVLQKIQETYGYYDPIHIINNSCVITAGLLLGEADFARTLCITLMCGLDTDCTCATAGSIIGAMLGSENIPTEWVEPLQDTVESLIKGYENCKISAMAEQTMEFVKVHR